MTQRNENQLVDLDQHYVVIISGISIQILENFSSTPGLFTNNVPHEKTRSLLDELLILYSTNHDKNESIEALIKKRMIQENGIVLGNCLLLALREYSLIPSEFFDTIINLALPAENAATRIPNEDILIAAVRTVLYSVQLENWKLIRLLSTLILIVSESNGSLNGSIPLSSYIDIFAPLLCRPPVSSFLDARHVKGLPNLRRILSICIRYGKEVFADSSKLSPSHLQVMGSSIPLTTTTKSTVLNLKVPPSSPNNAAQNNPTSPKSLASVLLSNRSPVDGVATFSLIGDTVTRFVSTALHEKNMHHIELPNIGYTTANTIMMKSSRYMVTNGGGDWKEAGIYSKHTRKRAVQACRTLRGQIRTFEEKFLLVHGHMPKSSARSPIASTYAQYREWKKHIRDFAAVQIQAQYRCYRIFQQTVSQKQSMSQQTVPLPKHMSSSSLLDETSCNHKRKTISSSTLASGYGDEHQSNDLKSIDTMVVTSLSPTETKDILFQSPLTPTTKNKIETCELISPPYYQQPSSSSSSLISNPLSSPPPPINQQPFSSKINTTITHQLNSDDVDKADDDGGVAVGQITMNSQSSMNGGPGVNKIMNLSVEKLQSDKKRIKGLLKKYDANYLSTHGRMPTKAEKEPIRTLYEEYHQVKSLLRSLNTSEDDEHDHPDPVNPNPITAFTKNENTPKKKTKNNKNHLVIESDDSVNHKQEGFGILNQSFEGKSWTELQTEKRTLHDMLKRYEREFEQVHGRPVQTVQDISLVQGDYDRYKLLKTRLEERL